MNKLEVNHDGGYTTNIKKVSMNLTRKDVENSLFLKEKLNERNQASVVSRSMDVVSSLIKIMEEESGSKLLIRKSNGDMEEIRVLGLF